MDNMIEKILAAIDELRKKGKPADELDLWVNIAPHLNQEEQEKLLHNLLEEVELLK